MGTEGDFNEVYPAWAETARWAKEVAAFRHAKIQSIRLAGDPDEGCAAGAYDAGPIAGLSIMAISSGCATRACSICRGYRKALWQIRNVDLPMNAGSNDQAE